MIKTLVAICHALKRKAAADVAARTVAESLASRGRHGEDVGNGSAQELRMVGRDESAERIDDGCRISDVCGNTGNAARHRLAEGVGEGFAFGGENMDVKCIVDGRHIGARAEKMEIAMDAMSGGGGQESRVGTVAALAAEQEVEVRDRFA